jgi:hypothetical protein
MIPDVLYAAKCYWPGVSADELEHAAALARGTGGTIADARADYVATLLFPDDELVLCLFDASSRAAVKQVSEAAGIPCERVMSAVWLAAT